MRRTLLVVIAVAVVLGAAGFVFLGGDSYRVTVMLASATNLVPGGTVQMHGFEAGTVESIEAENGKAKVTLDLDSSHTPLHAGASVVVRWKALVGERHLDLTDGPASNIVIPSGGMIPGSMPQPMEIDQVLAALDKPTRDKLNALVNRLDGTLKGHEQDVNDTVRSAGPALGALGEVLKGLGTDGPAIKALVTQVEQMLSTLSNRDGQVRDIVDRLSQLSSATVDQRGALAATLRKLPGTLDTAKSTLDTVPSATDRAVPLLDELKPATDRLPSVAGNLQPVLSDLRPLTAQLRPTLASASTLLRYTPGLLDRAHAVVPGVNSLVTNLTPAVDFLRPYTPELAGLVSNWGSAMGNYSGTGHYARVLAQVGLSSVNINPGITPPGFKVEQQPSPGALAGQPWTDAAGEGVR
ncbi:MlaD family protein [Sciscionella sediminilitoris]|uniref:MlaD family protein n=1 Tax=Sciscionella sediminilitoris TaxID=1445613 RepID=UPI0004DF6443|nr:MlaD family protein [Sciscionella sp. SE31]